MTPSREAPGGTFSHRFARPPQQAASCFARNAEEHSSALAAQVSRPDAGGRVQVVVQVRNGATYATADLEPSGAGATGTIRLNVVSSEGNRELMRRLVEGC
jgi:hypothetical protein